MENFGLIPPAAPLKTLIRHYIIADVKLESNIPVQHEFVPLNFTALTLLEFPGMMKYRVGGWDWKTKVPGLGSGFLGPMTQWSESWFLNSGRMVVIHFYETAIFRFFGLPQSAFLDTVEDAPATLDAQELVHLREKIFNFCNPMDMVTCLNDFFWNKLNTRKDRMNNMDAITSYVNSKKGNINIDWLMRQANMSIKTLERQFSEKIGFSPKFYARIVRFSHAMTMLRQKKGVFDIIEDCGYSDQSHFIKEMRLLTGRTPKGYFKANTEEEFGLRLLIDNLSKDETLK
jgi:AraC-like DNA-binding protein